MNNKFLVGGLIGGVACFLVGYLIYGLALGDMMAANAMPGVNKAMADYNWPFLVLGNLATGFLLSYVLSKSNTSGFGPGATMGAVVGLLTIMGFDFVMYATSNIMTSMQAMFIDMIGFTVLLAVTGGIIGAYFGAGKKA